MAVHVDGDLHLIADAREQRARILRTPIHVGLRRSIHDGRKRGLFKSVRADEGLAETQATVTGRNLGMAEHLEASRRKARMQEVEQ